MIDAPPSPSRRINSPAHGVFASLIAPRSSSSTTTSTRRRRCWCFRRQPAANDVFQQQGPRWRLPGRANL